MAPSPHSASNSRAFFDQAQTIEPQPTDMCVPVDHLDPNHPQFPHDLESKPPGQNPIMSKKMTIILAACFFLTLLGAVLIAGKAGMDRVKRPDPVTITPPVQIETIYMTTTVHATEVVPVMLGPGATTITTTTMLPLIASSTLPPPPPPEAPNETPKEENLKETGKCFWVGRWSTKKECEDKCAEMNAKTDQAAVCGENRGFYQCQTCKPK